MVLSQHCKESDISQSEPLPCVVIGLVAFPKMWLSCLVAQLHCSQPTQGFSESRDTPAISSSWKTWQCFADNCLIVTMSSVKVLDVKPGNTLPTPRLLRTWATNEHQVPTHTRLWSWPSQNDHRMDIMAQFLILASPDSASLYCPIERYYLILYRWCYLGIGQPPIIPQALCCGRAAHTYKTGNGSFWTGPQQMPAYEWVARGQKNDYVVHYWSYIKC